MPNTLVHFGVQALGSRAVLPRLDVRWLLLGPVIPDLPWILQRAHMMLGPFFDPYDVRLYATIQASLFFCLVFVGAVSLLSVRPRLVFGVLAFNCLVHLLLDSVEIKWANGVHLFAPVSWKMLSGGVVWPESIGILALTGLGLVATLWFCFAARGEPTDLHIRAGRSTGAVLLAGCYLAGPLVFLDRAEQADTHYVQTLRDSTHRAGRPIQLDRTMVVNGDSGFGIKTFAEETIRIANPAGFEPGTWSVQGRFLDPNTVYLNRRHHHVAALRQAPTYLGLLLLAIAWLLPWVPIRTVSSSSMRR